MLKTGILSVVVTVIVGLIQPLCADFKGHHAPGGWGLQSGSQATAPGSMLLAPLYSRYHSDKLVNNAGTKFNLSGKPGNIAVNALGLFGW